MKKKLAKLVLAITLFVSSLLFTGCDALLEGVVDRIFGKQVPVYQGMSITQVITPTATTVSYMSAMPCDAENGNKDNNGNHNGWYKGDYCDKDDELDKKNPFPDNTENENIENEIKDSLNVIGTGKEIYYASVGEDIYVNIHISNPDGFEIQSFTLNGSKYANYMFEDGSTMETIILKYNVGWESGIHEYTIDAIKYIDGTEIKDVKMSGDKTVRAGIRRENQVNATISNLEIGFNDISLNVNIADEDNLIEYSQGELKAVLYDGETLVATKDLTVGENEVSFNGLKTNGLYQYAIVGYYDNLKNGFGLNVLQKEAFYTQAIVLFDNITITPDGISYSLFWNEAYANESLLSLKLYQGETFVKELPVTTTEVNGLSATNEYTLIAEYKKDSVSESIALTFALPTKTVPSATLALGEIGANSISFAVAETDIDNAGAIEEIEIISNEGTSIVVNDLTTQEIIGLKSNTQYTLKVTYTYDTGDGSGAHEFVLSETFYTSLGDTPIIYEKVEDEYIVTGVVNKSITRAVIEDDIAGIPVTKIAKNTFSDCASLTDLVIGKNISSIGSYTFYNCFELTNIYISDLKAWCEIPFEEKLTANIDGDSLSYNYPFINRVLYQNFNGNLYLNNELITDLVIPDTLTKVHSMAFFGIGNIERVTVPDSVKTIGFLSFSHCQNLREVTIGSSKDSAGNCSINNMAFYNCPNLQKAILNSVVGVGNQGFLNCSNLTELELSNNLLTLNYYVFAGTGISEIIIPSSIQYLGGRVFEGCKNLKTVIISDGVQKIWDDGMFHNCSSLTNILIPDSVTSIGSYAFSGCSSLASITIPDSVTSIGESAFEYCSSLTSITIPDSVTSIEDSVFQYCSNLTSVVIPDSVTSIGYRAFFDCSSLTSVIIPNSVTSIGDSAFENMTGLTSLTSVYYKGTQENWAKINIDGLNDSLMVADKYYYSETEPTLKADETAYDGNYWRYVDGVATPWIYKKVEK